MKYFNYITLATLALTSNFSYVQGACDALPQVQSCESTTLSSRINACGPNDYKCQCEGYTYIAACFTNCPNDPDVQQMASKYDGLKQNVCTSAQLVKDGDDAMKKSNNKTESASASSSSSDTPNSKSAGSSSGNASKTGSTFKESGASAPFATSAILLFGFLSFSNL